MSSQLASLAVVLLAASAAAQSPCESAQFPSPGGSLYGDAVALSGGTLLVSDRTVPVPGGNGAVYVYEHAWGGWAAAGQLVPTVVPTGLGYGHALDLEGERAAVGSTGEWSGVGAAYVFELQAGSWVQTARLTASDAALGAGFGSAVALDGDRLVVGAYLDDAVDPQGGAAYVFERVGGAWTETARLQPSTSAAWKQFGAHVATTDGVIVVGGGDNTIHVFEEAGGAWSETAALVGGGLSDGSHPVAIDDGWILAGHFQAAPAGPNSGVVYAYEATGPGWTSAGSFGPQSPAALDMFGMSVDLDGAFAVVGAWGADQGQGAVFVFERVGSTWMQRARVSSSGGPATPGFGWSVRLDGDTAVGAAHLLWTDTNTVYTLGGVDPWTDLGGGLSTPATTPQLTATGSLCPGETIDWHVTGAPPNQFVVYVVGLGVLGAPFKGGTLVPSPQAFLGLVSDAGGQASLVLLVPALPSALEVVVQAWTADATAPAGYVATAGLTGTVP